MAVLLKIILEIIMLILISNGTERKNRYFWFPVFYLRSFFAAFLVFASIKYTTLLILQLLYMILSNINDIENNMEIIMWKQ